MTPLDALYRAQRAWERSQPQLFMELWPDDGLGDGETAHSAAEHAGLLIAEPAAAVTPPDGGGLAPGAEPCRIPHGELTAQGCGPASFLPAPAASPPPFPGDGRGGVSAPINTTETGANHPQVRRARLQKGA